MSEHCILVEVGLLGPAMHCVFQDYSLMINDRVFYITLYIISFIAKRNIRPSVSYLMEELPMLVVQRDSLIYN